MRGHLFRAVRDLCELPQLVIFTAPCRASKGFGLPSQPLFCLASDTQNLVLLQAASEAEEAEALTWFREGAL